ncbi:glycosyltransferase family 4 protein [uncultured Desulfobacter sp.]|uniref:glycosyltransferase family 4 protein n=1 Tax=uncultured Desulfobacter sp. TaxID=240139 RepID=UPI002AA695DF|nr:glycosyltransferase family 4 protein [uncultured Desulfobacter sp.]
MKTIMMFDSETQHYRQSIYSYFIKEFSKIGYRLIIIYDKKLNSIVKDSYIGIDYRFSNFIKILRQYNCKIIISFVWLRYKFLIPFLIYCRVKKLKVIVWSHGINLQNKKQPIKNQLYYLRQRLANALILFSKEQLKYIVTSKKKVFIANNTLNFNEFPIVELSKEKLKQKYGFQEKNIILCVARMNTNNRKPEQMINLAKRLDLNTHILLIGPALNKLCINDIEHIQNIHYYGAIYDQKIVNEHYKMADVFVMPGAIGLAINHAFYFHTPCIVEKIEQGPEAFYLREGINGYYYKPNDVGDLYDKLTKVLDKNNYSLFCQNAIETIMREGSIENMFRGFIDAVNFVEERYT